MKETAWQRLLHQISDGLVVPVVGPQLHVAADGSTPREVEIARRLCMCYGLDPAAMRPARRALQAVIGELRTQREFSLQDMYADLCAVLAEMAKAPGAHMPAPIQQLAEIADFRLYVTLTPDDLLARCLRQRTTVNEIVHSPYLPTSEDTDLPPDWQQRQAEVQLLYLFGKARTAPMYAVHEEDLLEYAHNIIARGSHSRERFIGELQHRNLLLLGSDFPDWLSRFFLRAANPQRLSSDNKPKRDWIVEDRQPEDALVVFLRGFSRDTELLTDMPPVDFVAELHHRWMDQHGGGAAVAQQTDEPVARQGALFFVSYSRQTDLSAAEAFVSYLQENLGVAEREIWFDRRAIEPGDEFGKSIFDGIRSCRYFVPLVSRKSDAMAEKFFRREWRAALDREQAIMGARFVVPQVLDHEFKPDSYVRVPKEWVQRLDFGHAPDGVPNEHTALLLRRLVREARSPLAESSR